MFVYREADMLICDASVLATLLNPWLTVVLPMALVASALLLHGWLWPRSFLFGRGLWRGDASGRAVALTLDGQMEPTLVEAVMRALAERDVRATWFVSGDVAARWPGAVLRWVEHGHGVGVMGWHGRRARWSDPSAQWRAWLDRCDDAIIVAAGFRPTYVRPAGGIKTPTMMREIAFGGQHAVTWTIRGTARRGHRALRRCAKVPAGGVVSVMLDTIEAEASAAFVSALIEAWERRGLRVVTMSRLLGVSDRR
jgi:peptidoglycan/xylan/chitin deacetylase (PgdA/CDA1 family)